MASVHTGVVFGEMQLAVCHGSQAISICTIMYQRYKKLLSNTAGLAQLHTHSSRCPD